jgi:hypothetical protein
MVSRPRFLRPVPPAPSDVDLQQAVYDLVLERASAMFGPGASFAVTLRTGDESDTMFSETVAETLAWDVSLGLETRDFDAHRHLPPVTSSPRSLSA